MNSPFSVAAVWIAVSLHLRTVPVAVEDILGGGANFIDTHFSGG